jgi:hypothetical protein
MNLSLIFLIVALVLFVLEGIFTIIPVATPRVNLIAWGLASWVLSHLVAGGIH